MLKECCRKSDIRGLGAAREKEENRRERKGLGNNEGLKEQKKEKEGFIGMRFPGER